MAQRIWLLIVTLVWTFGASVACSNHWREGSPDRTPEEVMQFLSEVQSAQGFTGGDISQALQYQNESTIYFADSPSPGFGDYATSLLAFDYLDWMGATSVDPMSLVGARVFFLVRNGGPEVGLVIGLNQGGDRYDYYAFSGTGSVEDDYFVAELTGANGAQIRLESWDAHDGVLDDVIQLEVYAGDSSGGAALAGKITTLFGYQ